MKSLLLSSLFTTYRCFSLLTVCQRVLQRFPRKNTILSLWLWFLIPDAPICRKNSRKTKICAWSNLSKWGRTCKHLNRKNFRWKTAQGVTTCTFTRGHFSGCAFSGHRSAVLNIGHFNSNCNCVGLLEYLGHLAGTKRIRLLRATFQVLFSNNA